MAPFHRKTGQLNNSRFTNTCQFGTRVVIAVNRITVEETYENFTSLIYISVSHKKSGNI